MWQLAEAGLCCVYTKTDACLLGQDVEGAPAMAQGMQEETLPMTAMMLLPVMVARAL